MSKQLSKLQEAFKAKLQGGRFRSINETLYTQDGSASFDMVQKEPELFTVYHEGFRAQVSGWPQNPLDIMIQEVRQSTPGCIVADMGCGEAKLAETIDKFENTNTANVPSHPRKRVYSFDLANPSKNKYITPCDIAHVPLPLHSVDIVIFCLSLMGTNYWDFICEADRILRYGGKLLIAEVRSRFESGNHNDSDDDANDYDNFTTNGKKRKRDDHHQNNYTVVNNVKQGIDTFVKAIENLGTHGYTLTRRDEKNTMFVLLFFRKKGDPGLNITTKSTHSSTTILTSSTAVTDKDNVPSATVPSANDVPLSSSAKRRKRKQKQKLAKLLAQQQQQQGNIVNVSVKPPVKEEKESSEDSENDSNDDTNTKIIPTLSSSKSTSNHHIPKSSPPNSSTTVPYTKSSSTVLPPVLKACVYKKR